MPKTVNVFFAHLLLAAFACLPLSVLAVPAGWTEFVSGSVTVEEINGSSHALGKGGEINAGDTIQTGSGRAQIRFADGGYISLSPGTTFRVEEYHYENKADGNEKGFFSLVKGGLRAITGVIGHANKQNYRIKTPTATIGIRGTEFLARMDDKLVVKVGDGAVYLSNAAGDLVLYKGQSGEVLGADQKPKYSNETPVVNAAGPKGATPWEGKRKLAGRDAAVYVLGENVHDNATACGFAGICQVAPAPAPLPVTESGLVSFYHTNWNSFLGQFDSAQDFGVSVTKNVAGDITSVHGSNWSAEAQNNVTHDSQGRYGTLSWGRWVGGQMQVTDATGTRMIALTAAHIIVGAATPTAELNNLAATRLVGTYSIAGYTTPTLTDTSTGATSSVNGAVTGGLTINFGTGAINMSLDAGGYAVSGVTGMLNYASSSFSTGSWWPGGASGSGTFAAHGVLSGTNAAQAGVAYKFHDGTSDVTGVVAFKQDTLGP